VVLWQRKLSVSKRSSLLRIVAVATVGSGLMLLRIEFCSNFDFFGGFNFFYSLFGC
jgi:hypothetical protein